MKRGSPTTTKEINRRRNNRKINKRINKRKINL